MIINDNEIIRRKQVLQINYFQNIFHYFLQDLIFLSIVVIQLNVTNVIQT